MSPFQIFGVALELSLKSLNFGREVRTGCMTDFLFNAKNINGIFHGFPPNTVLR
jgi:hypothetical protein